MLSKGYSLHNKSSELLLRACSQEHKTVAAYYFAIEVWKALLSWQAGKGAKRDLLHSAFSEEALDEAGARREAPPFAVVASTDYDLSVGRCGSSLRICSARQMLPLQICIVDRSFCSFYTPMETSASGQTCFTFEHAAAWQSFGAQSVCVWVEDCTSNSPLKCRWVWAQVLACPALPLGQLRGAVEHTLGPARPQAAAV